jgi:hypothetical protein
LEAFEDGTAYSSKRQVGCKGKGLDEANTKDWTVVDMKKDWKTVFSVEKSNKRN